MAQPSPSTAFLAHRHELLASIRSLSRDPQEAEDLLQDTWVTLSFSAHLRLTGDGAVTLQALHAPKGAARLVELGSWPLKPGVTLTPNPLRQALASGDRLVLVARAERMHALATVTLSEVKVSQEVRK